MLLGFDTAGFVFGLFVSGVFLIVGVTVLVSIVKALKKPKETIEPWEIK